MSRSEEFQLGTVSGRDMQRFGRAASMMHLQTDNGKKMNKETAPSMKRALKAKTDMSVLPAERFPLKPMGQDRKKNQAS